MKFTTWNVNSVKARLPHVIDFLTNEAPDVLMLQELKCQTEAFPYEAIHELGYATAVYGQKTYNGVAILSRHSIEDITIANEFFDDTQARVIEAVVAGTYRVISVYVPNGDDIDTEKYIYKLNFFDAFRQLLEQRLSYNEKLIVGGDFNVAPNDLDVYNPKTWKDRILCSRKERLAFRSLLNLGLSDSLRDLNPEREGLYTWWDYRSGGFQKNNGLRIDHLLLSPSANADLISCHISADFRAKERPSDHAPVSIILK